MGFTNSSHTLQLVCEHILDVARTNFLGNVTFDETCTGAHLVLAAKLGGVSGSSNMPPAARLATQQSFWQQLLSKPFARVRAADDATASKALASAAASTSEQDTTITDFRFQSPGRPLALSVKASVFHRWSPTDGTGACSCLRPV